MTDHHFVAFASFLSGAGSAVMQVAAATPQTNPAFSMLVPVISALVGGAVSYGILKGSVHAMEHDVKGIRDDLRQLYDLARNQSDRISNIEGRIGRRHTDGL